MTARKVRLAAAGLFLLSFLGLWLGHTLEYARVWGTAGLREELTGSVHGYMVLLALALGLVAGAGGLGLWTVWSRLGRRVDAARSALAAAWRGRQVAAADQSGPDDRSVSLGTRLSSLWLLLTTLQIGLYLLQENVEHLAAGYPAPGFGPITGVHWAAPLVHAGVALVLAGAAIVVARAFGRRVAVVSTVEAMLRAVASFLRRPQDIRPRTAAWQPAPLRTHGCQLWSRPPPLRATV